MKGKPGQNDARRVPPSGRIVYTNRLSTEHDLGFYKGEVGLCTLNPAKATPNPHKGH